MKTVTLLKSLSILLLLIVSVNSFGQWTQVGEDIEGQQQGDGYGSSVALSADGTIMAFEISPYNNLNTARIRVCQNINGSWVQLGEEINSNYEEITDNTKAHVAMSADGTIVVIGNNSNDENGSSAGKVRVFQYIDNIWEQLGSSLYGEGEYVQLGYSVSISSDGSTIAVGSVIGEVKVFEFVLGDWQQIGQTIESEYPQNQFGKSVDLNSDGTILAIGDPQCHEGGSWKGRVKIYSYEIEVWEQVGQNILGEELYDRSGDAISLCSDGNTLAIGSIYHGSSNIGQVRIFTFQDESWEQVGQNIDGKETGQNFGESVDLNSDGSVIIAGGLGYVRIYKNINEIWTQTPSQHNGELRINQAGPIVAIDSLGYNVIIVGDNENGSRRISAFSYSCDAVNNLDLGNDTILCSNNTIDLNPDAGFFFEWSTGENTPTITVSNSNYYYVTVTGLGCTNSDSIHIDIPEPSILSLGNNALICPSYDVIIDAGIGNSYMWSTGEDSRFITVSDSGYYYATVTNDNFSFEDSIHIGYYEFANVNLPSDTVINPNQEFINLEINDVFNSYLWMTGDTTNSEAFYYDDLNNIYETISVCVSDSNCTLVQSVIVEKILCQDFKVSIETSQLDLTYNKLLKCKDEVIEMNSDSSLFYQNEVQYIQNNSQLDYYWEFGDNQDSLVGNSVSNSFSNSGTYQIKLFALDTFECKSVDHVLSNINIVVPFDMSFQDMTILTDTVSIGDTIHLDGITSSKYYPLFDVSPIIEIPDCGELSFISTIPVSLEGNISENLQIKSIGLNIEHSFIADLQIKVVCPNGQFVELLNHPNDCHTMNFGEPVTLSDNSIVGLGYQYSFTQFADNTIPENYGLYYYDNDENPGASYLSYLPSAAYLPTGSFDDLLGCPINGNWELQIHDYSCVDNGYLFEWSIEFDTILTDTFEPFSQSWEGENIFNNNTDTTFSIPNTQGWHDYIYSVQNDIACAYDTIISVFVLPADTLTFLNPNPFEDPSQSITLLIDNCTINFLEVDSAKVVDYSYLDDSTTEITIHIYEGSNYAEIEEVISTPLLDVYELEIIIHCLSRTNNSSVIKIIDYIDTDIFTGIIESPKSNINIYPNPAQNAFTVQNDNLREKPYAVNCYSSIGVLLYSKVVDSDKTSIEISHWAEGIYIIEVDREKFKFIKK